MSREPLQTDVKIFIAAATFLAVSIFVLMFIFLRQPHSHSSPASSLPEIDRNLQPFALIERSGKEVSRESVSNKFLVVNFIHTGCSVSCEQVNKRMAEVQKLVANDPDVQLLSFTIDPRSDTPAALSKFADRFGADSQRWLFLTGEKEPLFELIETSFLRREPDNFHAQATAGFLDVDRIALVDKNGRVRKFFNGLQPGSPKAIVEMIQQLRMETAL